MSWPGAARSIAGEMLEKTVTRSLSFVAPTVRTCAKLAGYESGLPSWRSFPAEATTRRPAPKGVGIAGLPDGARGAAAEAGVDHSAAAAPRSGEAGDLVSDRQHAVGARVPELQFRLRVDPDDSLGVHGRAWDRGGPGARRLRAGPP